jgi:hypothetical protein
MAKAWPRFLPDATADALAYALIIEAYAIVVEQLREGHGCLGEAHQRALGYAESRHSPDEICAALDACAAAPDNEGGPLQYLVGFRSTDSEPVRAAA